MFNIKGGWGYLVLGEGITYFTTLRLSLHGLTPRAVQPYWPVSVPGGCVPCSKMSSRRAACMRASSGCGVTAIWDAMSVAFCGKEVGQPRKGAATRGCGRGGFVMSWVLLQVMLRLKSRLTASCSIRWSQDPARECSTRSILQHPLWQSSVEECNNNHAIHSQQGGTAGRASSSIAGYVQIPG